MALPISAGSKIPGDAGPNKIRHAIIIQHHAVAHLGHTPNTIGQILEVPQRHAEIIRVKPGQAGRAGDRKTVIAIVAEIRGQPARTHQRQTADIDHKLAAGRGCNIQISLHLDQIGPLRPLKITDSPLILAATGPHHRPRIGENPQRVTRTNYSTALNDRLPGPTVDHNLTSPTQCSVIGHHQIPLENVLATARQPQSCGRDAVAHHKIGSIAVYGPSAGEGPTVQCHHVPGPGRHQTPRPELPAVQHQPIAQRPTRSHRQTQIRHHPARPNLDHVASR